MATTRVDRGSTETTTVYTEGPEMVMERTFDAPRDLVWKVMTDPERITNWWGATRLHHHRRGDGRPPRGSVAVHPAHHRR